MGNAAGAFFTTYSIYEYTPPKDRPGFTQILSLHFKWILALWDMVSDILLCVSIFQTVGPASWMPWVSIYSIVCGLGMELFMTWFQFDEFKEGNSWNKKGFTELNSKINFMFFFILLLEDLPQIAVVLGYSAYAPKEPGTYSYYLQIIAFMTSIVSIFSKTTATAWELHKDRELPNAFLMLGHFMLLYMFPLFVVYFAAFMTPTNAALTYTALAMATIPQLLALVLLLLYFSTFCCPCIQLDDVEKGGCIWVVYEKVL